MYSGAKAMTCARPGQTMTGVSTVWEYRVCPLES